MGATTKYQSLIPKLLLLKGGDPELTHNKANVMEGFGLINKDTQLTLNLDPQSRQEARRAFIAILFSAIISTFLIVVSRGTLLSTGPRYTHPGTGLNLPSKLAGLTLNPRLQMQYHYAGF